MRQLSPIDLLRTLTNHCRICRTVEQYVTRAPWNNSHNDRICRLQIETQPTCSRRQNKDIDLGILRIKLLHESRSFIRLRAPVQSEIFPVHHLEKIFHDVHHFGHLEEDEHAMASSKEFGEDAREELEFARRADKFIVNDAARVDLVLDAVEEVGVLTDLAELHELVAEALEAAGFAAKQPS